MRVRNVWTYLIVGILLAAISGAIPINLNFKVGNTTISITSPKK